MQIRSSGGGRSGLGRAQTAGGLLLSVAAILSSGCTTSDGTLDPAAQTLLTTLGSIITAVVAGVVQGVAGLLQPLFTAGSLAVLF